MKNPFSRSKQQSKKKSYIDVAKEKGHTYFEIDDQMRKEIVEKIGPNNDEMWRLRKQFLDDQSDQGKTFELVSDPDPRGEDYTGFYRREIAYLRTKGYVLAKGEDCWHAFK